MNRTEKAQEIEAIKARLEDSNLVVLTHNKGITAQQSNALRRALGAEDATYKVAKNTLVKLAIKGTRYEGLSDLMA